MFELTTTKAKLLDVVVLSRKNRQPDENPGAKLVLQFSMLPDLLVLFDGSLRSFLFESDATKAAQGILEGVDDAGQLTRAGSNLGTLKWKQDMTGYTLTIQWGTGRKNIVLTDCALTQWRLTPKDGAVVVKVNCDAPDVGTDEFGKLAKLKSCEIDMALEAPAPAQQDLVPKNVPTPNPGVIDGSKGPGPWPFGANGESNAPADGIGPAEKGGSDSEGGETDVTPEPAKRGRSRARLAAVE